MDQLTEEDFTRAATALGCEVAAIKSVCKIEAPGGGFDAAGRVRILFEAHKFSQFTSHVYDATHPTISARDWAQGKKFYSKGPNADVRNEREHVRLEEAITLNEDAALKSASWGKFQIMGFNHLNAGFDSAADMVGAFETGEGAHLDAFVSFLKKDRGGAMQRAIAATAFASFASMYNGSGYKENEYDTKMQKAYEEFK